MCSNILQPWDRRNSMTAPVRNITLRFLFLSHVQVFSFVYCLRAVFLLIFVSWLLFFLLILVLSLLSLVAVICLHLPFLCSLLIIVAIHQCYLECWPVFFLLLFLMHNLSISSLGCEALCMVISLLVLWSICWSSSLVHFKNTPKYQRGEPKFFSFDEISAM